MFNFYTKLHNENEDTWLLEFNRKIIVETGHVYTKYRYM